mmetsp:Transcript_36576/g.91208  ORF Transcript_36576/g.91208 Transcript_36576/m.91208 type:complete len:84 (+) Transcript_36576:1218-1469(+)
MVPGWLVEQVLDAGSYTWPVAHAVVVTHTRDALSNTLRAPPYFARQSTGVQAPEEEVVSSIVQPQPPPAVATGGLATATGAGA